MMENWKRFDYLTLCSRDIGLKKFILPFLFISLLSLYLYKNTAKILPLYKNPNFFLLKRYANNPCIFIGCACQRERIRCPVDPNPLTMFPKRRILDMKDRQLERNLTINLSSNRLEMLPDDRFADLDVNSLDLSSNQISRISPDAFRDLIRLSSISLSRNRLRTLSASLFGPVKMSLETLELAENQLGEMETSRLTNVFTRLTQLRKLDLSSNRLVDPPDLSSISHLEYLDLRGNLLESLADDDTLEVLLPDSLVELYLDDNQLKHISENWFENLVSLRYLSI